jgi:hypothetical protein
LSLSGADEQETKDAMREMHEGNACKELWTAIQTIPFRLSDGLQEVGPVARTQMLFNIINS